MSKRPEIDEKKLGINPFIASLTGTMRVFKAKENLLLEYADDMNIIVGTHQKVSVVEDAVFTKVYQETFWRDIILDLSPNATKLWVYLCYTLVPNKDYIWINKTFLTAKLGLKNHRQLQEILDSELIRYALLSSSTGLKDVYWINPCIIFCGNRLKKYPGNFKQRN